MWDVVLDALKDSAITLGVVFLFYFLLSFCEAWLSEKLEKAKKASPLLGAGLGLIPQCGTSVVAADLYLKERISMGTLIAVFIACSDEALPIIASNLNRGWMVFPLLGVKFVLGAAVGFLTDLIIRRTAKPLGEDEGEKIHIGCCGHEIEEGEENGWHKHLFHPLFHSLKIFLYVFAVNIAFGLIIYYVGEDNFAAFLKGNRYLAPLYSTLIGIIPNCASSVIIAELYTMGNLSFGAALSGLVVNAGLGMVVLLKDHKAWKNTLTIFLITFFVALLAGYVTCLIIGF